MNYDTLLLSGGGFKCYSFLGILKNLIERKIIKDKLENITKIISVSGGGIYTIPLILGLSIDATISLFKKFKMDTIVDITNISLEYFLDNYGFYDSFNSDKFMNSLLEHTGHKNNITLKELYEKTKISLYFKTVNITKEKIVYLNHDTHPDLELKRAICMSSCVPLLFKPIKYMNEYYIDGGMCGNYPGDFKLKEEKYLGFRINSNKISIKEDANNEITNIIDYFRVLYSINGVQKKEKNKNIIDINVFGIGVDLSKDNDEIQSYLNLGYNTAQKHEF